MMIVLVVHTVRDENGEEKLRITSARKADRHELVMTPLSERQRRELQKLAAKTDSEIDYSDVPRLKSTPKTVHVGRFCKPQKQQVSLRLDSDALAWFRSKSKQYQAYMNEVLRREMQQKPHNH